MIIQQALTKLLQTIQGNRDNLFVDEVIQGKGLGTMVDTKMQLGGAFLGGNSGRYGEHARKERRKGLRETTLFYLRLTLILSKVNMGRVQKVLLHIKLEWQASARSICLWPEAVRKTANNQ